MSLQFIRYVAYPGKVRCLGVCFVGFVNLFCLSFICLILCLCLSCVVFSFLSLSISPSAPSVHVVFFFKWWHTFLRLFSSSFCEEKKHMNEKGVKRTPFID
jgi:hypothetical protein